MRKDKEGAASDRAEVDEEEQREYWTFTCHDLSQPLLITNSRSQNIDVSLCHSFDFSTMESEWGGGWVCAGQFELIVGELYDWPLGDVLLPSDTLDR